jgi:hypothetical protein
MQELKKKEMEELESVLGQLGITQEDDATKENESSAAAAKRKKKKEKKAQASDAPDEANNGQAAPVEAAPAPQEADDNGSTEQVCPTHHAFTIHMDSNELENPAQGSSVL